MLLYTYLTIYLLHEAFEPIIKEIHSVTLFKGLKNKALLKF